MSVLRMSGSYSARARQHDDAESGGQRHDQGQYVELGHYTRVLRQRWPLVVLGMLLGVLGGLGYLAVAPQHVQATAVVNLNVISSEPFNDTRPESQLIDAQTEVQLARSSAVLTGVAEDLGSGQTVPELRRQLTVEPVADATIVRILYTDASEQQALKGADAVATRYLAYRTETATTKVETLVEKLTTQQKLLQATLVAANKELAAAKPGSPAAVQAASDRQLADIQLTSLVSRIDQLGGVDTSGGELISRALDNPVVAGPAKLRVLPVALLLGLVLGILGSFLANRWDRRVRDAAAVEAAGGGPVLAELLGRHAEIPARHADLDSLRSLRERLLAGAVPGPTVLVIDLAGGEHEPSDAATNLGITLAESGGVRLLLPGASPSFTDQVSRSLRLGRSLEPSVYHSESVARLEVVLRDESALPSMTGWPAERASRDPETMTVVALPPSTSRSMCLAAGRRADVVILVVRKLRTTSTAITELVRDLDEIGARVQGTILVDRGRSLAPGRTLPRLVPGRSRRLQSASGWRVD